MTVPHLILFVRLSVCSLYCQVRAIDSVSSGFVFLNFRLQAGLQLVMHCSGARCQQMLARSKSERRTGAQVLSAKLKDHTRAQHAGPSQH